MARRLADAEQALYRNMRPPDYLIVLEVRPQVSMQRKPDHEQSSIEAKAQAVSALIAMEDLAASGIKVLPLNANQPLESVLAQLKAQVWALL